MKTLNKIEFIKILKEIVTVLEKEEIKYDIPYVHIDKMQYNYIDILITDNITIFELNKMYNLSNIKEKDNIYYTNYQDFNINFIKTNLDEWGYTFHYYCWNILHNLIDVMVRPYNLQYTRYGLKYLYKGKSFLLTKNMKDIFDFLELKFKLIALGFPTDFTINNFVEDSPYFDSKSFSMKNFKEYDAMFDCNKEYYENFLKNKNDKINSIESENLIDMLDGYFPNSKLLAKISRVELKESLPDGVNFVDGSISKDKMLEETLKNKSKKSENLKSKLNLKKYFFKKDQKVSKENNEGFEIDL